jgi:LemA protein
VLQHYFTTFGKNIVSMKALWIVLGVILLVVLMGGCGYNGMNQARLNVDNKWADVQSSYQRRSDLIPNLVATVKGAANFETTTLTQVIEARAKATSLNVNASDLTPDKMHEIQQSQGQISQALGRLLVVSEQYPQLRATESFRSLQDQLEGTENRIKVSRDAYNEAVRDYNAKVTNFPNNLLAGMFNFKERPMFQADQGAQNAPKVQF